MLLLLSNYLISIISCIPDHHHWVQEQDHVIFELCLLVSKATPIAYIIVIVIIIKRVSHYSFQIKCMNFEPASTVY